VANPVGDQAPLALAFGFLWTTANSTATSICEVTIERFSDSGDVT
jgi:hypothetical protein